MYESNPFTFSDAELVVFEDTVTDYTQRRRRKRKPQRPRAEAQSRRSTKQNRKKRHSA